MGSRSILRRRALTGRNVSDWSAPFSGTTPLCDPNVATGPGFTTYTSLSGAIPAPSDRINSAPQSSVVSFGAVTITESDFDELLSGIPCAYALTRKGLRGVGIDSTVLTMLANSSTKAGQVPTQAQGGTNQIYFLACDQDGMDLSCMTLRGTSQGHLYNGIRMMGVQGGQLSNLKLLGVGPGDFYIPPGENFAINDFQGNGNLFESILIDGRADGATGHGEGASGFGQNSTVGGTFINCEGRYNPYSGGWALWQGEGLVELYDCRASNNRTQLNLERMGQETFFNNPARGCRINVYDFVFGKYELNDNVGLGYGQDILLANDRGSTELWIYDPIITPGRFSASSGRDPNRLFIYWPVNEQGNPNLQLKSDVHVVINGVEVSAATRDAVYIQWSR